MSGYDAAVMADTPVFFMADNGISDTTGRHIVTKVGIVTSDTTPNGDTAPVFNGLANNYLQVPDHNDFSISTTRALTIECWMRPDADDYPATDASSDGPMVHFLGKGVWSGDSGATSAQFEYQFRTYGKTQPDNSTAIRWRRMSTYVFNSTAGLGAGSFYQYGYNGASVNYGVGDWRHIVMTVDDSDSWRNRAGGDGYGIVRLFINGILHDSDTLGSPYYIRPSDTIAPFRIGTTDKNSYFKGSVAKVAVYNYTLGAARITEHYNAML